MLHQTKTTTSMCKIYKAIGLHFLLLSLSSVSITVFVSTVSNQIVVRKRTLGSVTLDQWERVIRDFRVLLEPSIHLGGFHFLTQGTLPEPCVL